MRLHWITYMAAVTALAFPSDVLAERPPEQRDQATHVVLGTVEGVYVREDGRARDYLVEIAVEKIEKGDGLKLGEPFFARCYLWNPDFYKGKKLSEKEQKQLAPQGPAYDGVPKEGERVRVYAKHRAGKYHGIYPDWYDVVPSK